MGGGGGGVGRYFGQVGKGTLGCMSASICIAYCFFISYFYLYCERLDPPKRNSLPLLKRFPKNSESASASAFNSISASDLVSAREIVVSTSSS